MPILVEIGLVDLKKFAIGLVDLEKFVPDAQTLHKSSEKLSWTSGSAELSKEAFNIGISSVMTVYHESQLESNRKTRYFPPPSNAQLISSYYS